MKKKHVVVAYVGTCAIIVILGICAYILFPRKEAVQRSSPFTPKEPSPTVSKDWQAPLQRPSREEAEVESPSTVKSVNNLFPVPEQDEFNYKWELLRLQTLSQLPPPTDGAELFVRSEFAYGIATSSLSSDGKLVAVEVLRSDQSSDVYLYSLEDHTFRNLTESISGKALRLGQPKFSPDGRKVLVSGFADSGLWAIDIEGGEATLLVDNQFAFAPNWSSDGRYVTYTVADIRNARGWVEVYDVDKGEVIRTIVGDGNDTLGEATFSPDGERLAYVRIKRKEGTKPRSLIIESLDGSETKALSFPHDVHTPLFSPDGEYIAYRGGTSAWGEIYIYSLSDGIERKVTAGSGSHPSWLPDGKGIVFISSRKTGVPQVYYLEVFPQEEP